MACGAVASVLRRAHAQELLFIDNRTAAGGNACDVHCVSLQP